VEHVRSNRTIAGKFSSVRCNKSDDQASAINERNASVDALRDLLIRLKQQGVALGHFNVADLVLVKAVVAGAVEVRVPIVVGTSDGERDFLGTYELAALVNVMPAESDVPVFLNADHTHSLARAVEAARAGFDAVVIDFSVLPFDQNASRTRETVDAIKAINPAILAEGEIGDIGTRSEIHETVPAGSGALPRRRKLDSASITPAIEILAPAVGNMHGMLKSDRRGTCAERGREVRSSHQRFRRRPCFGVCKCRESREVLRGQPRGNVLA